MERKTPRIWLGAVGVAEGGDEQGVGVPRIDEDAADLLGVLQAGGGPGLAPVRRAEEAAALGDVRAHVRLAGAGVDGGWGGWGDGEGADGADRE